VTSPPWLWRVGDAIEPLRELVRRGGVLAVPTESSYGLAVDPLNPAAVETVYRIKGRERDKPLPIVACDRAQAERLGADLSDPRLDPLMTLWPGALTLVVPLRRPVAAAAASGSIAIRVPAHTLLRDVLRRLETPLTATSANRSGAPPVRTVEGARSLLSGYDAAIVDGGTLPGGPPSTLVALTSDGIRIVRQGAVPAVTVEAERQRVKGT
jgi:L-threonylcarbamoyladenylate synthase